MTAYELKARRALLDKSKELKIYNESYDIPSIVSEARRRQDIILRQVMASNFDPKRIKPSACSEFYFLGGVIAYFTSYEFLTTMEDKHNGEEI